MIREERSNELGEGDRVRKAFRFMPETIRLIEARDKKRFPTEKEFVEAAVTRFCMFDRVEALDNKLNLLCEYLNVDIEKLEKDNQSYSFANSKEYKEALKAFRV